MLRVTVAAPVSREELRRFAEESGGVLVKAVVDLGRGLMPMGGPLHADDMEAVLLGEGSNSRELWGINLYPEAEGSDFLEVDSIINVRPALGNRSRGVDDPQVLTAIEKLVALLVKG